jgi:hypothetical protein
MSRRHFSVKVLEIFAKAIVYILAIYASVGLVFAVPFVWLGVQRLDSEARGSGIGFRLLILPGTAAFWPMFLYRWRRGVAEPPAENNPDRLSSKA